MDRFPLPETAGYRYEQRFSTAHLGTDIFADKGTPVLAVENGVAWATRDPKGGNVVYLDGSSGVRYYYAHLWQWTPLLAITDNPKVSVNAGAELGYVGTSGNAEGRPPHLHFQMRRGSLVIDPFDSLLAVDPHRSRGTRSASVAPAAGLLALVLLWALSR